MDFGTFEQLKAFIDSVFEFIEDSTIPKPYISGVNSEPLDNTEERLITHIYDSYDKGKGTLIKTITADFLHLLDLLIPSPRFGNMFKELIHLEWMEHRIKTNGPGKLYRDHILHCANVCWVGQRLIFDLEDPFYSAIRSNLEQILSPQCKNLLKNENQWQEFITITWYITAILHDFGYPIELVQKKYLGDTLYASSKNYFQVKPLPQYFRKQFSHLIPLFQKQLRRIDNRLLKEPFYGSGKLHPIIGSLELLHFLMDHTPKLSAERMMYHEIYQLAALGIFEHHKEGAIDFDLNPFGYILALADTLHEWHRYVCIDPGRGATTKLKFLSPINKVSIRRKKPEVYHISFRLNPQHGKCETWEPKRFKESKQKELSRLRIKKGLPCFSLS